MNKGREDVGWCLYQDMARRRFGSDGMLKTGCRDSHRASSTVYADVAFLWLLLRFVASTLIWNEWLDEDYVRPDDSGVTLL